MTRMIVCDTGPLLHLSEAGAVHLLSIAGRVLIPPLVVVEFEANAQGWQPPQWVKKSISSKGNSPESHKMDKVKAD